MLAIGDDPVPAHELGGDVARVGDRDRVAEDEVVLGRIGLIGHVRRLRHDGDLVTLALRHRDGL
jgi:hypothetical protein